jgi:hypothetical protein
MSHEDKAEESVLEYEAAIQGGLDQAAVGFSLGDALEKTERPRSAQGAFEKPSALDPGFLPALHSLQTLFFFEGRFDRAEALEPAPGNEADGTLNLRCFPEGF